MKLKLIVVVAAIVLVAGAAFWIKTSLSSGPSVPETDEPETPAVKTPVQSAVKAASAKQPSPKAKKSSRKTKRQIAPKTKPVIDEFEGEDFSSAEKALAKKIAEAVDAEDFARVVKCVDAAASSSNPEIRSRMVSALQWFGRKGMSHLTSFMMDSNEDIRLEALDAWQDGLQEIESPTTKRELLISSLKLMNDPDAVESLMNEVTELPNSYQIDVLTELIRTGNSVVREVAKEEYEFLTDEEFTTTAAAEKWLQENPDDDIDIEDAIEKDAAEGVKTPLAQ